MNEHTQKILEQATYHILGVPMVDQKKFAELIVAECIGVVEGGSFLHDQAPTAIFARECSGAIKRHFGVEE